jgi:hypothetical protein
LLSNFTTLAWPQGRLCRFATGVALLLLLTTPGAALAQSGVDRDRKSDSKQGEQNSQGAPKDFSLEFNLPVRYSSNVASPTTDSLLEHRADGYASLELVLKWSHQFDWAKLSAEIGAGMDRYFAVHDANLDSLFSTVKIQKTDGKSDRFVPYALLSSSIYYDPTFSIHEINFYDIAGGFYTGIGWRDKYLVPNIGSVIPYADAMEPGDVSVLFDFRVGRRQSDVSDYQNTFIQAKAELAYTFAKNWRAETAGKFRARWYNDYFGDRRVDYRPGASIGVFWSPDWLKVVVKRSEISLEFEAYRNYSNLPDKNYSLWELGPTLSLRTKF